MMGRPFATAAAVWIAFGSVLLANSVRFRRIASSAGARAARCRSSRSPLTATARIDVKMGHSVGSVRFGREWDDQLVVERIPEEI
jgi:hypothetical protein